MCTVELRCLYDRTVLYRLFAWPGLLPETFAPGSADTTEPTTKSDVVGITQRTDKPRSTIDLHSTARNSYMVDAMRKGTELPLRLRRRAVVWHSRHLKFLPYLYSPVTSTLRAGFQNLSVEVTVGSGTRGAEAADFRGNLSNLVAGDVYIWVGMGRAIEMRESPWRDLQRRGVLTVLYQTEPVDGCKAFRAGGKREVAVDEIWDFSLHNLLGCIGRPDRPLARHVPIAHVHGAPVVDEASSSTSPRPMVFFGDAANHPQRGRCYLELKAMLGDKLVKTYRAFTDDSFGAVVKNFDIFVNLHKECGVRHNPVTWRSPKLLNSRKMVISERAHPLDELEYDGMLLWADNMSDVARLYRQFAAGGWRKFAERAHERFKRRFDAAAIFERAGIYDRLRDSHTQSKKTRERPIWDCITPSCIDHGPRNM
jgi:hypothetical protein